MRGCDLPAEAPTYHWRMPARDFYIDRLRSVMTALVIFHHTAITYGAIGGWIWREVEPSRTPSGILLILFCSVNQAYFMGFFFLLAGYFTPASLERKGYARFILDRCIRLGLPLLAFGLLLGPFTAALVTSAQGEGFWPTIGWLWRHKQFINGPLWFAQALLIFSLAYCAWRTTFGSPLASAQRVPKPVPGHGIWLLASLGVGRRRSRSGKLYPLASTPSASSSATSPATSFSLRWESLPGATTGFASSVGITPNRGCGASW